MKPRDLANLERIIEGGVDYNFPMSRLTSIRIGGPAWAVVHPMDEEELMEAMAFCRNMDISFVIIGAGTNLLVPDRGIEAVVIRIGRGLDHIRRAAPSGKCAEFFGLRDEGHAARIRRTSLACSEIAAILARRELQRTLHPSPDEGHTGNAAISGGVSPDEISLPSTGRAKSHEDSAPCMLDVEAGVPVRRLLGLAAANGLSGVEFLAGIPGTVGGAVASNAGAAGRSISEAITRVRLVNTRHERLEVEPKDLCFTYRSTRLPPESAVSHATFLLFSEKTGEARRKMREIMKNRMQTQPLRYPSAGCVFKNPPGDFAGRLIESVGMKGLRRGDAQISDLHANFIINRGNALASDVISLMEEARARVLAQAGIELEPEIRILGKP